MSGRVCSEEGCERPVTARGMCRMHYLQKWRDGAHTKVPVRDKHAPRCPDDHAHDLATCWMTHGCRCSRCVHLRKMDRQRRRNRLIAYGQWEEALPEIHPIEPVREHVLALRSAGGFGLERIAEAAGVSTGVVFDVVYGRRGSSRRQHPKGIHGENARRILALSADAIDPAFLPSRGTARRLRALVAIGYSESELAKRLGILVENLSPVILTNRSRVTAARHEAVRALFDELWATSPEGRSADRARRLAARRGWFPPLAWDDIDTDDEPTRDVVRQGRATGEEVLDDVAFLLDAGESPEQIAVTIGRKAGAVAKLAERHGRPEIATRYYALEKRAAA